ncbi:MAG TPA: peptidylprolyl isomerase [Planctomycetota bacterium]|nr:peptidylprolyl isomerase [Planctomycetota bacterium]
MKRSACAALTSLLLLSACGKEASTNANPPAPAKPAAAPTESAKAPVQPAKPPVEPAKPAEAPKAPAEPTKPAEAAKPPAENAKAPAKVVDMDADIAALMAKPEVADSSIEIQHILISFKGAPRMPPTVTRSKDEAKALAQKVYAEVMNGGNFDALVKQYTNDSPPGIYPMTKAGRAGMVKGFGDVGFRLKVGEIGVAPWDASASPYGWHIIKRLK